MNTNGGESGVPHLSNCSTDGSHLECGEGVGTGLVAGETAKNDVVDPVPTIPVDAIDTETLQWETNLRAQLQRFDKVFGNCAVRTAAFLVLEPTGKRGEIELEAWSSAVAANARGV